MYMYNTGGGGIRFLRDWAFCLIIIDGGSFQNKTTSSLSYIYTACREIPAIFL